MKTFPKVIYTGLLCGLVASNALAATQGTSGPTSSGTSDISVTIPKLVQITGIADLAFGTYDGAGAESLDDDVCIYSNMDASGKYTVRIDGADSPGTAQTAGFWLGNANTNEAIAFTMTWNDQSGTGGSAVTHAGAGQLATQDGFSDQPNCGGTPNANFTVNIAEAELLAAKYDATAYTNTITILITPE